MSDDPRIDPADLRNVRFPGSSRRYDARSVDQFLETVAARITATNVLIDDLRAQLAEAPAAPAPAPPAPAPVLAELDEDELVRLVGEETTTVLAAARRAAEEIRSKAEESAARVIREATAEADRVTEAARERSTELTAQAEATLETATAEAEAEASRIIGDATEQAERARAESEEAAEAQRVELEARRAEVEAEVDQILAQAREEGRGMVAEAREVRGRILDDLQRRRDIARDHIERLLAGRERLLAAYEKVRENLDDITGQLTDALPDPGEPDLPDGFVGIVGGDAAPGSEEPDHDDEDQDELEVASDDPVAEGDDTVAPAVETETETETEPEPEPEPELDVVVEWEPAEPKPETDPEPVTELDADEAEAHETGPPDDLDPGDLPADAPTGDVDALFARLRAEREESVAKAQQLLEAEPEEAEAVDESEGVEEAEVAPAVEAEPEPERQRGGDVDRLPPEFLAPEAELERRADALRPLTDTLNRALKRRLSDEQNELLDLLRRSGSTVADELLPALDAQVEGYASLARRHLATAAAAGGGEGADIGPLAEALGRAIVEPFRRRLERSAADVDGDADELDERLRALYREWKAQHIGPATDDALLSAYARGTLHGAAGGAVRWCIDPAQGPCPDAQDNALAGAVDAGEVFPTGDLCPQAHPGCRCLLVTG